MKVAFKSLIAAAAFIAAGSASAAVVTVDAGTTTYKGVKLTGSETLVFSPDALMTFDTLQVTVTSNAPGVATALKDTDGIYYADVTSTAPITSLTIDDTVNQILSATTSGGLTLTNPRISRFTLGGAITLTDLSVDLVQKKIYATVIGANGVGTLPHFNLWNFDTATGNINAGPVPGSSTAIVFGLHLTAEGTSTVATALGLSSATSKSVLASVMDFGSIAVSTTVTPVLTPCTVTIKSTAKNAAVFASEVTIHNGTTNASTGWNVNWTYGVPTLLTNIQNAKITNKSLKAYTAQPGKTNATVAAGGTTTFSFRGHANGGGIPAISDLSATLGGQSCPVTAQ
jgi:hypothetical protein